jgi:NADH-quinone oxidoreductase subunit M
MLSLARSVFFGPVKEPHHEGEAVGDMNFREWAALGPIMALCLLLGVYPQPAIEVARPDLQIVEKLLQERRPGAGEPATAAVTDGTNVISGKDQE